MGILVFEIRLVDEGSKFIWLLWTIPSEEGCGIIVMLSVIVVFIQDLVVDIDLVVDEERKREGEGEAQDCLCTNLRALKSLQNQISLKVGTI